ncbi:MAG: NADH-quinone oxidoreductase subunit NuoF [Spirochaetota bacterium]|nr:NADH-quinone oxidoreductase subunit NuoF [Spirochaetota bacterium]
MTNPLTFRGMEIFREECASELNAKKYCIRICMTGCKAYGAEEVRDALQREISVRGLAKTIEIRETGCQGFCAKAPVLTIDPMGIFYQEVSPADVTDIIVNTIQKGDIIGHLLYEDVKTGIKMPTVSQIPFFKLQNRRVLKNCGVIDPKRIKHYIGMDGYGALAKALSGFTPDEIIKEVEDSGLRGRGGAGFPTGRKWRFARYSPNEPKYIICNADEGDPGAFMDRAVLEGDPHRVIEGMIIGAYAIGARFGYIYVREEYPIAVEHLSIAIEEAKELGILGDSIFGSNFSFDLRLKKGAGAFVCGEETALMASIEGKRGMPRTRPPFPAQAGLDGKPSNINNVETFANIAMIIQNGAQWYSEIGTDKSKGTKVFSLAGKVNNTGLVEVPIGIPIRDVIFNIGGGIPKGRKFKAVQMGGPSGGCVPEKHLNMDIDYESLQSIGSIMGSGGMVVMDENNCMVEIARFFLNFTRTESCGKCSPCRLGTKQMLEILTRITEGRGQGRDIEMLIKMGDAVMRSALCGLGQTCPKPVLSTIKYFRDEYEAHINEKRCKGAVCEALVISACHHTCPVGISIPKYIAAIAEGDYLKAAEVIRERNPFPAICGRICHHPCEIKCRRGELDDPVAIRSLKRFAADRYYSSDHDQPLPFSKTKSQKVAVIGAGPTGLTCAFYLARMGYPVTVFEALPVGGGMLMVGVPEFRLPKEVVQKEIEYIEQRGVEIQYNTPVNINFTLEDIKEQGHDAIFIAGGAQKSQRIGIPGEDEGIKGFYYGLSFLRDVKLEKEIYVGRVVVVIGGGNVAFDVARSALRVPWYGDGQREVHVICLESREEMPAFDEDIEEAIEEDILIHHSLGAKRIISRDGSLTGVETLAVASIFDEEGKFNPTFIPDSEGFFGADTVIMSVGQAPDLSFLPPDSELERTKWETLVVNSNTLSTNISGIFAGGDFVTGPTFIIESIAAGRRGAVAIDKYLRGDDTPIFFVDAKEDTPLGIMEEELSDVEDEKPRVKMPTAPPEDRIHDFREIELGFTEEKAVEEAKRCLRCDLEK